MEIELETLDVSELVIKDKLDGTEEIVISDKEKVTTQQVADLARIEIDKAPTKDSTNAVSSGGVYNAIDQSLGNVGAYLATI